MPSGSAVKNVNNGELDALFLSEDIGDSPFIYPGYRVTTNFSSEVVDIDPQDSSNVGFGKTSVYKIDLQGSYLGKVAREVTLAAVTPGAYGGSYYRWVDNIGTALSDEVQWKYGTRTLPKYQDFQIETYDIQRCKCEEEQQAMDDLLARNKTPAERDALATGSQVLISEVPAWFDVDPRLYTHQHSLAQELQVRFQNRTVKSLLDHDGTEGTPTSSFTEKLKCLFYHVSNMESNAQTALEHEDRGRVKMITTYKSIVQKSVDSGSTSVDIDISGLTNPSKGLFVCLRKTAQVNGAGGFGATPSPNDFYNYQAWSTLKGSSSNGDWYPVQSSAYNRLYFQPKVFLGRIGGHEGYINHSFDPMDKCNAHGHLSHGNMNNPKLTLTFSALSEAHVVDVFSLDQEVLQEAQGDIKLIVD